MGNLKARMFNREASHPQNRPEQVIECIGLKSGQVVADIGAGGGYFALRFAEVVGEKGRVYAVDTDGKLLKFVERSARKRGLKNVHTHLVEERPQLPEKVDVIFMRNVTHHLRNRVEYFRGLKDSLKPSGRVAIIEYRGEGCGGPPGHYVPRETIIQEMKSAGYHLETEFDFLPGEHFTIYSKE